MDARFVGLTISILWLGWMAYWAYSARGVKTTSRAEPARIQLAYRAPLVLAILFLTAPGLVPPALLGRFVPAGPAGPSLGIALIVAGLGFAVWARRHLGRNWSASVVVKHDHTLIRTGPYRRIRHPIYSGMLLAFLGTIIAIGEWRGLVALPLAVLSFLLKSRLEEARMTETFPEYADYRRSTAALIPGLY
ncbi:MAG TPA: isoprenylcysteine carboxylmethyltransferase family protein [Gemmatimonadales bacterium]|nr:isoprenylcysteine carboxylmethyltransferase family protein [Gemmatimonadales bacterium]